MTRTVPLQEQAWLAPLAGVATAAVLLALAAGLQYYAGAKARLEAAGQVRMALGDARLEIDRRLETALAVPETLAVVVASTNGIDDATFRAIAGRLIRANPSIRNLALAPDNVIRQVYPLRGNARALGLVYAELPDQYPAVLQAMRTRATVVAGPIDLVQGGTGLASRTPVFLTEDNGLDSRYWGLVALVVDVDELFENIARIGERHGVAIAVRRADPGTAPGEPFAGDAGVFDDDPIGLHYPLPGGGRWEVAGRPRQGWEAIEGLPMPVRLGFALLALAAGWLAWWLVASHQRERMLASRDPLTGLLNRKAFDLRLARSVRNGRSGQALVVLDLDDFKPVNDTHGHSAGDRVLVQIARRLQRAADPSAAVYRIGGDEFALLLQGVEDLAATVRGIEAAVQRMGSPVAIDAERTAEVGACAGVAPFPLPGGAERALDVFDRADRALYRAKALGQNAVQVEPPGQGTAGA